jgi:Ca2+-binding EF-hand superfamily protein
MTMSRNDKDGDGTLSADEIKAIDSNFRSMITAADADADGSVTKAELTKAMTKRMGGGSGR